MLTKETTLDGQRSNMEISHIFATIVVPLVMLLEDEPTSFMDQSKGIYKDELYGVELKAPKIKQRLGKTAAIGFGNDKENIQEKRSNMGRKSQLRIEHYSVRKDDCTMERGQDRKSTESVNDERTADDGTKKQILMDIGSSKVDTKIMPKEDELDLQLKEAIRMSIEEERRRKGKMVQIGKEDSIPIMEGNQEHGEVKNQEEVAASKLLIDWYPDYGKEEHNKNHSGNYPLDESSLIEADVRVDPNITKAPTTRKVHIRRKQNIRIPIDVDVNADARMAPTRKIQRGRKGGGSQPKWSFPAS